MFQTSVGSFNFQFCWKRKRNLVPNAKEMCLIWSYNDFSRHQGMRATWWPPGRTCMQTNRSNRCRSTGKGIFPPTSPCPEWTFTASSSTSPPSPSWTSRVSPDSKWSGFKLSGNNECLVDYFIQTTIDSYLLGTLWSSLWSKVSLAPSAGTQEVLVS